MSEQTPSFLKAKKSLGQNFLHDNNIIHKIILAAGIRPDATVIEVGPGQGALTTKIAEKHPAQLILIEKDTRFIELLRQKLGEAAHIIHDDALRVEAHKLGQAPRQIVSNLPYNVGTQLLFNWLPHIKHFTSLTLMFQKEVAERIVAKPRTSAYGRLSVMCQWVAKCRKVMDVPPTAFKPQPKIWSTVVQLTPLDMQPAVPFEIMGKVVKTAFSSRRKMIKKNLQSLLSVEQIEACGISPTARAEELSVEEFAALARNYAEA